MDSGAKWLGFFFVNAAPVPCCVARLLALFCIPFGAAQACFAAAAGANDDVNLPRRAFHIQLGREGEIGSRFHVEQRLHARRAVAVEIGAAVMNIDPHTHTTLGA